MIYRCSSRRNLQRHWWEKTEAGPAQNGRAGRTAKKGIKADKGYALTERKIYSKMTERGKDMAASLLLDFYGQTLTGKQRDAMELYYNEDLSLSEIAENLKISRQAALDSIQRAQKHLNKMEHQLGMLKKYRACADAAAEIERLAKGGPAEREILRQVQIIRQAWEDN